MTQRIGWGVGWFGAALAAAFVFGLTAGAQDLDCATCHSQPQDIKGSPHEQLGCATCHGDIAKFPHGEVQKPECTTCHAEVPDKISMGRHVDILPGTSGCTLCHGDVHQVKDAQSALFHEAIPAACGACHDRELADFQESVHGMAVARGRAEAPVCATCHRGHDVQSLRNTPTVARGAAVIEMCASCHADVRLTRQFGIPDQVVGTYESSFHGLALNSGVQTVANCASCHGSHKILPPDDPASTIAPQNLSKTCGQCHPGAGTRFVIGQVHAVEGQGEPAAVTWARVIYRIAIPMVVGFMLLHQFGDWMRKALVLRFAPEHKLAPALAVARGEVAGNPAHFRMHRMERLQHGWLIISFTILVWSGFALRYSDHWWAQPLMIWERGVLRGVVHRTAGALLIALAVWHVITLIVRPELRKHWQMLWLKWRDLKEFFAQMAYNAGLRKTKPEISSHSYIEKVEYWAVIWGTALMAITGLMLWANTFMLTWAPRVVLQVASVVHFYEAVLATLSIIVWHFYVVIFDPEVYPVDPAWLTGYSVRRRGKRETAHEPPKDDAVS